MALQVQCCRDGAVGTVLQGRCCRYNTVGTALWGRRYGDGAAGTALQLLPRSVSPSRRGDPAADTMRYPAPVTLRREARGPAWRGDPGRGAQAGDPGMKRRGAQAGVGGSRGEEVRGPGWGSRGE